MKRIASVSTLVTVLLLSFLFYGTPIHSAESQSAETIYIRADRTVEGTGKIQRDGNVYSFRDDIRGSIEVEKNDIILDGANYVLSGTGGLGLLLSERSNVTIRNMDITGFGGGIYLNASSLIYILENNILDNSIGITLTNHWVVETGTGFWTKNISISKNTIAGSNIGIDIGGSDYRSSYNNISGNTIAKNQLGIKSIFGHDSIFVGNSFIENNGPAIHWSGARRNIFYHNNFIRYKVEGLQVSNPWLLIVGGPEKEANTWDNGFEGNYWSDYASRYPNASEVGGSGIWDTPFFINEVNVDNYPLMYSWSIPPEIYVLTVENATYIESFPLNFTVDKSATWMGYSLDGQDNVTIAGNTTITGLTSGLHNVTIYAKDEFGNVGASETVYFTIIEYDPESFPAVLVAVASGASLAAIGVGLLVYFKKRKH